MNKPNNDNLETDLRRYYHERFDPVASPHTLWIRINAELEPKSAAPVAPKRSLVTMFASIALLLLMLGLTAGLAAGIVPNPQAQAPYAAELRGAVVLRPHANPPGLYIYNASGWRWLTGSDTTSRMLGRCADGELIYDVAVSGAPLPPVVAPPLTAKNPGADEDSAYLGSRRLAQVAADGSLKRYLAFNPLQWSYYTCSTEGVVAWQPLLPSQQYAPNSKHMPPSYGVAYQPANSDQLITPTLPQGNWYILAATPVNGDIVLAEDEGADQTYVVSVYAADANAGNRHLLDVRHDAMNSAEFSPDGRYVHVGYDEGIGYSATNYTLYDAAPGAATPILFSHGGASPSDPTPFYEFFLTAGPRTGQMVSLTSVSSTVQIQVYSPATPAQPLSQTTVQYNCYWPNGEVVSRDDARIVLSCNNWDSQRVLIYVDPSGVTHKIAPASDLALGHIRGGVLYYYVKGADPGAQTAPMDFYRLTLSQFDDLAAPKLIASQLADVSANRTLNSWWLSDNGFAYVTSDGALHVSDTAGNDSLVETDVAGFGWVFFDAGP